MPLNGSGTPTQPAVGSYPAVIERIERKVQRIPFSGCWIFMGALNQSGYGWVGTGTHERKSDRAHRLMYQHYVGPIPDGKELDHLCRVRSCCNPFHLEAVTRKEHCQRGECGKATGAKNRAKTHCKQGHAFTPENTYTPPGTDYRTCRACLNHRRSFYRRSPLDAAV